MYQTVEGFGGAFTGAVAENLVDVDQRLIDNLFRSYFSQNDGIGYTIIRNSIGGSDFDLQPWAYNEQPPNDLNLSNFKELDQRDLIRVKHLKRLVDITNNHDIKLLGSAWSAPPWMKNSGAWSGPGTLKDEYYQLWADYHLKYLELMAKENVTYWGITTGNEPLNGIFGWIFIKFICMGWTPTTQAKWVVENLGPTLKSSKFNNVKIIAGDDQRYTFPYWFLEVNQNTAFF